MYTYYLKSALRSIWKNKKFSLINVSGFAFAISVSLAIVLLLIKEYSYDRYHENANQIVRLTDTKNNSSFIDYRVKDILINNFPEIENACILYRVDRLIEITISGKGYYLNDIMSVDNQFFEVFTLNYLAGHPAFHNINSAVITESTSRKLFGNENPLGKEMLIHGNTIVTITSVIKDFPENSSISAGLLVNAENDDFKFSFSIAEYDDKSTWRWPFQIYLQLDKRTDPNQLLTKINHTGLFEHYVEEVGFLPLKDMYLNDPTYGGDLKRGNPQMLLLFVIIAAIVLGLAVINYINLTVAQQAKRNKDTGVRKTMGANRRHILLYFLCESVLITLIAFFAGLLLLAYLIPFYQSVFNTALDMGILIRNPYVFYLIGAILLIGLVSGAGPAIVLSDIKPAQILNGNFLAMGKRGIFQNALTIFQFTASIVLIFCIITIQRQIQFVKGKDLGFQKEQLLRLDLPSIQENDNSSVMVLLEEFKSSPFIKNISVSGNVPGRANMMMGTNFEDPDKNISITTLLVDSNFLRTFEIEVIKGRDLLPGDFGSAGMLNETAFKLFEFDNLDNKRFNNYGGFDIIGVVNDFHFSALHDEIGPAIILFTPHYWPRAINIRFTENAVTHGMGFIHQKWNKILPEYPLNYQFYDEWFDSMYRAEERLARTIAFFAILAIVISCIGILGLAIFSSERRIKEIGIRKVNGAKAWEVILMLNKDFAKMVAIAFVIATPIAWYAMSRWLQNFAYRTELSWWIFAFAGLLALGIAILTVSWQSWQAAKRNPVEALRYE